MDHSYSGGYFERKRRDGNRSSRPGSCGGGVPASCPAVDDECFGAEISGDKIERNDRFIEEALELVQSTGYSADRAHALVDHVFGRDIGEPSQEIGGGMVTMAALCLAHGLDMHGAGEAELARINQPLVVEKIRAKQAAKPTASALPIPTPAPTKIDADYLICKYGGYYRPHASGYTTSIVEAGRYTLTEAISHSHPNGPDGPRDCITYELTPPQPAPRAGENEAYLSKDLSKCRNYGHAETAVLCGLAMVRPAGFEPATY